MALHYAMVSKEPLAGVIAVGGYLLKSTPMSHINHSKLLLLNGENDKLISEKVSKQSYERVLSNSHTSYIKVGGEGDDFGEGYMSEINHFLGGISTLH